MGLSEEVTLVPRLGGAERACHTKAKLLLWCQKASVKESQGGNDPVLSRKKQ